MKDVFQKETVNRDRIIKQAKVVHERRIKKQEYEIGDYVLTDHPKLKKRHSHGIAHKYYGPYVIMGKNSNGVDYFIKLAGHPKAKIKQIHINRLKTYFHRGQPITVTFQKEQIESTVKEKRNYIKNPDNQRWKINDNNEQVTNQTQK
jgi:hypothetical protein